MSSGVAPFFHTEAATRLGEEQNYPPGIAEFLRCEHTVLERLAERIDVLVEVACMDGRYLDLAAQRSLAYVGIDPVPERVEAGRREVLRRSLPADRFRFVAGQAEWLGEALDQVGPTDRPERTLVLFGFSIFSALADIDAAAEELAQLGLPFLISVYRPTAYATASRVEYYQRCGYTGIEVRHEPEGVSLTTAEGLRTIAYHPEFLESFWARHGLAVDTLALSSVNGVCASESLAIGE